MNYVTYASSNTFSPLGGNLNDLESYYELES